jgi:hypothetical protein
MNSPFHVKRIPLSRGRVKLFRAFHVKRTSAFPKPRRLRIPFHVKRIGRSGDPRGSVERQHSGSSGELQSAFHVERSYVYTATPNRGSLPFSAGR